MARRKGRVKDKWREKRWVTVNAQDSFNNVPIGYVPITDDENASGRVLEVTLYDILKEIHHNTNTKSIFKLTKLMEIKHQQFSREIRIFKRIFEQFS